MRGNIRATLCAMTTCRRTHRPANVRSVKQSQRHDGGMTAAVSTAFSVCMAMGAADLLLLDNAGCVRLQSNALQTEVPAPTRAPGRSSTAPLATMVRGTLKLAPYTKYALESPVMAPIMRFGGKGAGAAGRART